ISRGQVDAGLAHIRRASELDSRALRPRFALAEEIERSGLTPESRREAERLYDGLLGVAPDNLAILVERARLAAARDVTRARERVAGQGALAEGWPTPASEQFGEVKQALDASNTNETVRA